MTGDTPVWPDDGVILFDGVCVLCSGWVNFVVQRDAAKRFRFTPVQSPYGRRLATTLGIDPDDPDTNAVVIGGRAFRRSDAALEVLSRLPYWSWVRALWLVPEPVRDAVYNMIARNRYRLFGRHEACDLTRILAEDRIISDTAEAVNESSKNSS